MNFFRRAEPAPPPPPPQAPDVAAAPPDAPELPAWKRFRVVEWVITICLLIFALVLGTYGPVTCRVFTWNDGTINQPFKPDTFPSWSLGPIGVLPVLVYTPLTMLFPVEENHRFEQTATTWLMHLTSITIAELIVEPTKLLAGRQRPDFLNRLRKAGVVPPTNITDFHFTYYDYCDLSDADVREGRRSFPSGHSSTTFASMLSLSLFLIHRLGGIRRGSIVRVVIGGLPMVLAFIVAVSRTWDYHHNFSDVLAGSILGSFAAFISHQMFFEPVGEADDVAKQYLVAQQRPSEEGGLVRDPGEAVPKYTVRRRPREALELVV